jgi:nitronate monooxygenase
MGIEIPILLAPMAGACGALMMKPNEIEDWCTQFRSLSQSHFQINLWIPEPSPVRDFELEKQQREFLAKWGPEVPAAAGGPGLRYSFAGCHGSRGGDFRADEFSSRLGPSDSHFDSSQ